jgi:hypothetical protein
MTYACPAWEFAAESHLLKLQRLQNKVFRTIGNFPRRTPVRDMHVAFQIPYVYNYITKSCRQQAKVILNHENENVRYVANAHITSPPIAYVIAHARHWNFSRDYISKTLRSPDSSADVDGLPQ